MRKGEDLASMILVFEVENLDLEGSFLDRVVFMLLVFRKSFKQVVWEHVLSA